MLGLFRLSSDELGHAGNGEGNDPVVGGVHETLVDKIGSDRAKGVDRLPKAICYLPGADTDVAFPDIGTISIVFATPQSGRAEIV